MKLAEPIFASGSLQCDGCVLMSEMKPHVVIVCQRKDDIEL
jgi:hypothetical protein